MTEGRRNEAMQQCSEQKNRVNLEVNAVKWLQSWCRAGPGAAGLEALSLLTCQKSASVPGMSQRSAKQEVSSE